MKRKRKRGEEGEREREREREREKENPHQRMTKKKNFPASAFNNLGRELRSKVRDATRRPSTKLQRVEDFF